MIKIDYLFELRKNERIQDNSKKKKKALNMLQSCNAKVKKIHISIV